MFLLGDPSIDLWITVFLVGVSFIISLVVFALAKRKILALIVFSILVNLSLLLNIGSEMFRVYHIKWLGYFSILIWPLLNIFFIAYYIRTKPKKGK